MISGERWTRTRRCVFSGDEAPGDVSGQGQLSDVWWVVDGAGKPIRKAQARSGDTVGEDLFGQVEALRLAQLPLLPCLQTGVVVEAREDPSEEAEPRLAAPAVLVAVTREESRRLPGLAHESEEEVADDERCDGSSHGSTLGLHTPNVNGRDAQG